MKVFSQLVSAQIENRTADYSAGTRGRVWMRTDTSPVVVKFDDGSAVRTLVTTDNSQTLTNKTLTSPVVTSLTGSIAQGTDIDLGTAANTSRLTVAKDTLANITALTRKEATIWYASDTDKLYKDDGTILSEIGSGSGGDINYIGNPDAESATTGWATYADAAGASPVDGTGGSPTTTLTRTTTTPLRGTGSFLITKDAANRQGEGVSYAFTINNADKAKVLNVSFDYEIPSGTFASGDSSDLRIWVYDVTNSVLIPVSPYTIQGGGSSQHKFTGVFQTASNSTSYRLIIHIATTSASAWTFEFDNVVVGPQIQLFGAPIGDWTAYTPTSNHTANVTHTGFYRRVGDSMECMTLSTYTGATTATTYDISIPSGYTIDDTKQTGSVTGVRQTYGVGKVIDGSTAVYLGTCTYNGTTKVALAQDQDGAGILTTQALPITIGAGDFISMHFTVPITGWSSTVLMSNDTDTRVCAAQYTTNTAQAIGTETIIDFEDLENDTHSAVTVGASWKFTAPLPGFYRVSVMSELTTGGGWNAGELYELELFKNGVEFSCMVKWTSDGASSTPTVPVTGVRTIKLNAGDYIDVRGTQTSGASVNTTATGVRNWINIERVSGPSAIAATESVNALYESNTARSISNASATTGEFLMEDKIFDTHGAYNTSTAIYTVPISGKYRVGANSAMASGGGWAATEQWQQQLFKNGSYNRSMGIWIAEGATTVNVNVHGTTIVSCVAGDTLEVRILQNSGGAQNTNATATDNWVSYERIGN